MVIDYTIVNKLTNHLENKPKVKAEVDWSDPTMSYIDTSTGEVVTVYLLCWHASLQPVFLCRTHLGYEDGFLYLGTRPYV